MIVVLITTEARAKPKAPVFDLPTPPQAEAQEYVKSFAADYERVSADPAYLVAPSKAGEWSCELSETEKYTAFGLSMALPEEMEKARKQIRKSLREAGMDPDSATLMKYENIRIIPVSAQAKEGKLDGEADVWTEYTMSNDSSQSMNMGEKTIEFKTSSRSEVKSRGRYVFEAGVLKTSVVVQMIETKISTIYSDAAMNTMMEKNKLPPAAPTLNFIYGGSPVFKQISFMVADSPIVKAGLLKPSVKYKPQVTLMLISDAGEDRMKMEMYQGKRPLSIGYTKNGKPDGEQIIYMEDFVTKSKMRLDQMPGMERAKFVTINGEQLIEKRTYFKNGLEIKTAAPTP